MNKEFKNIWRFIKSENPALATMGISMANGLNNQDNTNYRNSDNIVSMLELKSMIQDKVDFLYKNIPDVINPKLQCKQWFWFYISALIMGNQDRADYNLNIYNSYQKEV
jgi:hypothetical protein|tara:strand:- start:1030 stop:1356 length:327 start_codon:yes stop_codon:yes gene_type:complete